MAAGDNSPHLKGNGTEQTSVKSHYEALIIGAGLGGLRMLYELGKQGLSARAFESGSGVGGTWYWNRYPGARTDSEAWVYIFTFLEDMGFTWTWKERFPTQPEVEEYMNYVADSLDLRKNIELNTRIESAHRDEARNLWIVTTSKGETFSCTYLIAATGPLATPLKPDLPGLEGYKGEWYQTALWPKHDVDFTNKRVAVVGTGATAVQVIPIVAHNAKHLTVFQRTANYVLPARNYVINREQSEELKRNHTKIQKTAREQGFGMDIVDTTFTISDVANDAEAEKVLDRGWEVGGFRFRFETFCDMSTNQRTNDLAANFVREKIRNVVRNPQTAELLCPDHQIFAKRLPLGHFYYEAFNRDNVELVDVSKDPLTEMTPTGVRTKSSKEYEFDMIIFAIGFDAVTGTLASIDLRGSDGQLLGDHLRKEMSTAYGITVRGFPNFFMISGPQAPIANIPVVIDNTAHWIGQTIAYMRATGQSRIETSAKAQEEWNQHVNDVFNSSLLAKGTRDSKSWFIGANVEGKKCAPLFYFGGVPQYFQHCANEIKQGFPGYIFEGAAQPDKVSFTGLEDIKKPIEQSAGITV